MTHERSDYLCNKIRQYHQTMTMTIKKATIIVVVTKEGYDQIPDSGIWFENETVVCKYVKECDYDNRNIARPCGNDSMDHSCDICNAADNHDISPAIVYGCYDTSKPSNHTYKTISHTSYNSQNLHKYKNCNHKGNGLSTPVIYSTYVSASGLDKPIVVLSRGLQPHQRRVFEVDSHSCATKQLKDGNILITNIHSEDEPKGTCCVINVTTGVMNRYNLKSNIQCEDDLILTKKPVSYISDPSLVFFNSTTELFKCGDMLIHHCIDSDTFDGLKHVKLCYVDYAFLDVPEPAPAAVVPCCFKLDTANNDNALKLEFFQNLLKSDLAKKNQYDAIFQQTLGKYAVGDITSKDPLIEFDETCKGIASALENGHGYAKCISVDMIPLFRKYLGHCELNLKWSIYENRWMNVHKK